MALYPRGDLKLITPGPNDPQIDPVGAILHVDAGNADTLKGWFSGPSGGIESHFHVKRGGRGVEQYRDTRYEADANLAGNSFWRGGRRVGFVSIETQGYEHGEWDPEQLADIKDLLVWLATAHGFPLADNRSWDDPGVAYHVKYGAPGAYTGVRGKTCPGPDRIRQYNDILVPWMQEEDDVSASDVWQWDGIPLPHTYPDRDANPNYQAKFALQHIWTHAQQANERAAANKTAIAELSKAVTALAANGGDINPDELVARIQAAIDEVTIRLETGTGPA